MLLSEAGKLVQAPPGGRDASLCGSSLREQGLRRTRSPDWARPIDAERTWSLLFDYDGTLVPIAEHPEMALPRRDPAPSPRATGRHPVSTVGVLSGRANR